MDNNQRIAKNTVLLYIRTFVVLCISLFTTRLILQALGELDLGIYNVVGGIVVLLSIIQGSLTGSTSRFITFEIGRDSSGKNVSRMISLCFTMLVIVCAIFVLLGESVGLWIVQNWIVVPSERQFAANIVYQFALFTLIISMLRVPFDSIVIAHERMSVYAYMSIAETVIKLLIAYYLLHSKGDRLILYSMLILANSLIIFFSYYIYVKRRFKNYRIYWIWDNISSKSILKFSVWTLVGTSTNTATQQGVNLLMNNFVGLIANTALGFAGQAAQAVNVFVSSFTTAFNPQVIKYYSSGNLSQMHQLMFRASKFSFILAFMIALPLVINMDFVLELWLKKVPVFTAEFCQLIVICSVIDATTGVYNMAITASGKIKWYQLCISISFMLDLLCAYILLSHGVYAPIVFASRIFTRGFLNMGIGLYFSNKNVRFNIHSYIKGVILPILLTLILTIVPVILVSYSCDGLIKLLATGTLSILLCLMATFYILMTRTERGYVFDIVKNRIKTIRL